MYIVFNNLICWVNESGIFSLKSTSSEIDKLSLYQISGYQLNFITQFNFYVMIDKM